MPSRKIAKSALILSEWSLIQRVLRLNFARVMVGEAFGGRVFHGKIRGFEVHRAVVPVYIYIAVALLSIAIFYFLLIRGLSVNRIETEVKGKKAAISRSLLVVSVCAAISVAIYFADSVLVGENNVFRLVVSMLSVIALVSVLVFLHHLTSNYLRKVLLAISYSAFFLYAVVYSASVVYALSKFEGQDRRPYGLSIDEIAAIYQTSISEGVQFVVSTQGVWSLAAIIVVPLLVCFGLYYCLSLAFPVNHRKITLSYALTIVCAFYLVLPSISTYPVVVYGGFLRYAQMVDEMKKIAANRKGVEFDVAASSAFKGTYVLVLGESSNRDHYGAYGYFRNTTPWLSSNQSNPNFVYLDNAYAPYAHTVPSLMKVLTEANQYNQASQLQAVSILDVAKAAGFETYWLSEQYGSLADTPLSVLIRQADHVKYVDEGGQVVRALEKVVANVDRNKSNLIVVHLMGSHADYKRRLVGCNRDFVESNRAEVGNFVDDKGFMSDLLNPYDSSIKCTDALLKKIFDATAGKFDFVDSFVYVSDHGEDVYGKKFHNSADFSYPMVRVPLVFYFSDRFIDAYPNDVARLRSRVDSIFTTDLLYDTFLDVLKIKSKSFSKMYSLLDVGYSIDESNAVTMSRAPDEDDSYYTMTQKRYVRDDPMFVAKRNVAYLNSHYPGKVLAVDNDLVAKAYHSRSYGFAGSEFNVALSELKLGHFPDYIFDTKLKDYLCLSVVRSQDRLWLDLKSPAGKDIGYSVPVFESIDSECGIKKKVWIESWESGLGEFGRRGWNTLYYIQGLKHSGNIGDEAYEKDGRSRDLEYAREIAAKVADNHINGISFFSYDYGFVKGYLEPLLPRDVGYHVFGFGHEYQVENPMMIDNVEKSAIFNDVRVHSILLDGPQTYVYRAAR